MAPRAHAILGASSSHRWMECPGSIKLSEGVENIQTEFAREGSAAHEIAELCLRHERNADYYEGQLVPGYGKTEEFDAIYVDEQMALAVQLYLDTVREEVAKRGDAELWIEAKFDLSHIYPGMFGTNDAIVYDSASKKLTVFDYKHGQGISVEVERNPQLMYYALGALTGKHNRPIDEIELVIVQPRCPHRHGPIRRWRTYADDVLAFSDELIAAAQATKKSGAEFKAGEWCKFCPAAAVGRCEALTEFALELSLANETVKGTLIMPGYETLSPTKKSQLLTHARTVETWYKGIKKAAHDDALRGNVPPGYRVVQSKPRRAWKDEKRAVATLQDLGFSPKEIFTTPELKPPTQMDKFFVGRKKLKALKKIVANMYEHRSRGFSLVNDSDPRPNARPEAEDEFGD